MVITVLFIHTHVTLLSSNTLRHRKSVIYYTEKVVLVSFWNVFVRLRKHTEKWYMIKFGRSLYKLKSWKKSLVFNYKLLRQMFVLSSKHYPNQRLEHFKIIPHLNDTTIYIINFFINLATKFWNINGVIPVVFSQIQ